MPKGIIRQFWFLPKIDSISNEKLQPGWEFFGYIIQQKIIVYKTTLLFSSKKSSLQVSGKPNVSLMYLHQLHESMIYGVIPPSSPSI